MMDLKFVRQLAVDCAVRFFGVRHVANRYKRSLRAFEEVVELMQANEVPADKLIDVVKIVYARRPGTAASEIGHALLGLLVLTDAIRVDPEFSIECALADFLGRDKEEMIRRNAEKDALGL